MRRPYAPGPSHWVGYQSSMATSRDLPTGRPSLIWWLATAITVGLFVLLYVPWQPQMPGAQLDVS